MNGLQLHFLDWGTDGKPPLLLLHGLGQGAHTWNEFAPFVSPHFRVLALDQRGHGDSEWAPGGDYASQRFHEDLA
ncbi:MAG: alpha/beta fold hydrolase, partial [Vicinamibacteria bacterium]